MAIDILSRGREKVNKERLKIWY